MRLYEQALKVAAKAHKDQERKHDSSPYIVHPVMVARIVEKAGFGEIPVAAALVHDVLEDSDMTEALLREILGDGVVDIVAAVSEDKMLEWEERKVQYVSQVVKAGESVWAVSVADKIHNADSLIAFHEDVGAEAWTVFNRGKEKKLWFEHMLYDALCEVWKHPLLELYKERLDKMSELED